MRFSLLGCYCGVAEVKGKLFKELWPDVLGAVNDSADFNSTRLFRVEIRCD